MTLLVTGATGFVGAAVVRTICASYPETPMIWATHRRELRLPPSRQSDRVVAVDLADPGSIRAAIDHRVDAVLHLALELSGSDARLHRVNDAGCRVLVDACAAAGVRRIVRLSTLAVYGRGPWCGVDPATLRPAPTSVLSRSRLAGDQAVIDAGGCVVRPHLVWGPGDRWVLPRMIEITTGVGWIDHGRARHSLIHVSALAQTIVSAVLADPAPVGVIFAAGTALNLKDFLSPQLEARSLSLPTTSVTLPQALDHRVGQGDPRWRHDIALIGTDHYLRPSQLTSA